MQARQYTSMLTRCLYRMLVPSVAWAWFSHVGIIVALAWRFMISTGSKAASHGLQCLQASGGWRCWTLMCIMATALRHVSERLLLACANSTSRHLSAKAARPSQCTLPGLTLMTLKTSCLQGRAQNCAIRTLLFAVYYLQHAFWSFGDFSE